MVLELETLEWNTIEYLHSYWIGITYCHRQPVGHVPPNFTVTPQKGTFSPFKCACPDKLLCPPLPSCGELPTVHP